MKAVSAIMLIGIIGMLASAMLAVENVVASAVLVLVFEAITLLGNEIRKRMEDQEVCWK